MALGKRGAMGKACRMRLLSAALPLVVLVGCSGDSDPFAEAVPLTVMTRNVYLGADLEELVTIKTLAEVPARVDGFRRQILASDFPARARLIAAEVAAARPDVLAVQELELFRWQSPGDYDPAAPVANAEVVVEHGDMLAILQAAFVEQGLDYGDPAVVVTHTDAELPALDATTGAAYDLRLTDRDALFVRPGLAFANPRGASFDAYSPLRIPQDATGYPIPLKRGYAALDLDLAGTPLTVTATHLEVGGGPAKLFQELQAEELLAIVKTIPDPQLVIGDFNSDALVATTDSYARFAAEFTEAWPEGAVGDPGPTCCMDLAGEGTAPGSRIDLLFHRGWVKTTAATRTGLELARTPGGLLASDHLGAAFTLLVGR
jgi:endonuclease/exonuclease/phosphatase family metal-dependent hydrolase